MKKIILSLGLAVAATLTLTNCAKENVCELSKTNGFSLFAGVSTKTVNDSLSTNWAKGDKLSVFYEEVGNEGNFSSNLPFSISEADLASNRFVSTATITLDDQASGYNWHAIYPYSSYLSSPDSTTKGYITVGGSVQTQKGNNSMAHLSGTPCPLYGCAINVPVGTTPSITMKQVTSAIEVVLTNTTKNPVKIKKIEFTADQNVVGSFYIDFTSNPISFVPSDSIYVYKTATLNVSGGELLNNGQSAKFYFAVKPFTTTSSIDVKIYAEDENYNGGTVTKTIPAGSITFTAGKIKTINVDFNKEIEVVADPTVRGEYKYTFNCTYDAKNNPFTANGKALLDSLAWIVNSDSDYFGADNNKGQQFGSSTLFARNVTLTTSKYADPVNLIVVKAGAGSSATATIAVSVNGVAYLCGGKESAELSTSGVPEYEFTPAADAQTGNIVITYNQPESKKALYMKYISINEVIPPSISPIKDPSSVEATGDTVSVTYSISHPVSGKTVSASSAEAWVHDFDYSKAGEISFIVDENTDSTARNSVVTVSYEGATSVQFTVSQKAKGAKEQEYSVSYDLTKIVGFSSWTTSYAEQKVTYDEGTIVFNNVSRQTQTITDCPVTKGKAVEFILKDGKITAFTLNCVQWGSKLQTIILNTSTDKGVSYSESTVKSQNFTITSDSLPKGTNAIKFTFSNNNHIGIKTLAITYLK